MFCWIYISHVVWWKEVSIPLDVAEVCPVRRTECLFWVSINEVVCYCYWLFVLDSDRIFTVLLNSVIRRSYNQKKFFCTSNSYAVDIQRCAPIGTTGVELRKAVFLNYISDFLYYQYIPLGSLKWINCKCWRGSWAPGFDWWDWWVPGYMVAAAWKDGESKSNSWFTAHCHNNEAWCDLQAFWSLEVSNDNS